jgi:flagellar biosynthesis/type III secretory pathway M-ring protein FliF/YscJ
MTKHKDDEQNKDNTNDPAAPHVKTDSLSSSTTTTIIIAAAVSAVVVLVVIIVVVIIIVTRRRRRGGFSLPEQGMPLRAEVRIANQQTYDSDDSGFDDLKAESERRALQGHQPPS